MPKSKKEKIPIKEDVVIVEEVHKETEVKCQICSSIYKTIESPQRRAYCPNCNSANYY